MDEASYEDLTGKNFGRWTVLGRGEDRINTAGYHKRTWICRCSCDKHTVKEVREDILKKGESKSCGCLQREKAKENGFIDLTGQKFGRLTVKKLAEPYINPTTGKKINQWLCDCDCGTKDVVVRGTFLRNKTTQSCGCLQKEKASLTGKMTHKYNEYNLSNEYGIGYTSNTNKPFYFDLEDYDKIKNFCWFEGTGGYINSTANGKRICLHKLIILGIDNIGNTEIDIDHIHGNGTRNDNRKSNLRIATRQENLRNKTYESDNTSGFIGVSFRANRNKWRAYINIERANNYLLVVMPILPML